MKNRKLQERVEQLERKVQFREKIIRELRRSKCQVQVQNRLLKACLVGAEGNSD